MHSKLFIILLVISQVTLAQTGLTVSPPRLYFESTKGQSTNQKITITNVSNENTLDLAVSLGDWQYDKYGENITLEPNTLDSSCASWITIKPEDSYFSLKPGEKKELEVVLTNSSQLKDTLPVHSAILYVSQMNPIDDMDSNGTKVKVSVRSGVKIYHKQIGNNQRKIEIQNAVYKNTEKAFLLQIENKGNIWGDGKVFVDILDQSTGKKISLPTTIFYTMPGNKRDILFPIPESLTKAHKYLATFLIDYGDDNTIEMAELQFLYD